MGRAQHPALRQPRWREDAACRPFPTWWWFTPDCPEAVQAYVICTECEVREECLEFALDHADLLGTWAGTSADERVRMRRARRRADGAAPRRHPSEESFDG